MFYNRHTESIKIMSRCLTIGFVGAGGDGVVVLGSLLQRLTALQGYYSQMPRYYEPQIRGGGSAAKLGIDTEMLSLPKDTLDLLICFDWAKYIEFAPEMQLRGDSVILYEKVPPAELNIPPKRRMRPAAWSRVTSAITSSSDIPISAATAANGRETSGSPFWRRKISVSSVAVAVTYASSCARTQPGSSAM